MSTDREDQLVALAKRWSTLLAALKDVEFKMAEWAKEARALFRDDRQFILWCETKLGMKTAKAQDLCVQALVAREVPDAKTWSRLGGLREMRAIAQTVRTPDGNVAPLFSKKEQVAILEKCKATGVAVRTEVRARIPYQAPRVTPPVARMTPAPAPVVRMGVPPPVTQRFQAPVVQKTICISSTDAAALVSYFGTQTNLPLAVLGAVARLRATL